MKFRLACTVALRLVSAATPLPTSHGIEKIVIQGDRSTTSTIGKLPEAYAGGQVAKGGRLGIWATGISWTRLQRHELYGAEDRGSGRANGRKRDGGDPSVRKRIRRLACSIPFYIRGFPVGEGNFGEIAFDGVYGIAPNYRVLTIMPSGSRS